MNGCVHVCKYFWGSSEDFYQAPEKSIYYWRGANPISPVYRFRGYPLDNTCLSHSWFHARSHGSNDA